ncbi:MAG TPA: response regulator transcription factor [Sandaracinaceae bacterium LLY-WYZ-13_1]|nr:response regulator transcription factor [Sandaracinaceae bacterium LLY-WYZ-13_1]
MTTASPLLARRAPLRVAVVADDRDAARGLERSLREHGVAPTALGEAEVAVVDAADGALPTLDLPILALVGPAVAAPPLLEAGAAAVLARDAEPARICAALVAVCSGLVVVDGGLERAACIPALSPRERQVLALVAEGLSNKRIAGRLGISAHTAKFFVSSILTKLDVATRTEAVAVAARAGLV